jgi:hypothetical protein
MANGALTGMADVRRMAPGVELLLTIGVSTYEHLANLPYCAYLIQDRTRVLVLYTGDLITNARALS